MRSGSGKEKVLTSPDGNVVLKQVGARKWDLFEKLEGNLVSHTKSREVSFKQAAKDAQELIDSQSEDDPKGQAPVNKAVVDSLVDEGKYSDEYLDQLLDEAEAEGCAKQ